MPARATQRKNDRPVNEIDENFGEDFRLPAIGDAEARAYDHRMDSVAPHPDALGNIDLLAALADARIQTLYQPVVQITDRTPVGLEVLARLDDPQRGTLSPSAFVAPMEDAGLALQLSEAVIRRAFADWRDGRLEALNLTLAINLPLDVLLIPSALTWLDAERTEAGIDAGRIIIELTESQPISRLADLSRATHQLRASGYGIAIDDVGPNIRDHSALLDLPFTMLKLDKYLVQESLNNNDVADFLTTTLHTARTANLIIIAEGVEDTATWQRMANLGVDQAQGFLVSHPIASDCVAPWMASWRSKCAL